MIARAVLAVATAVVTSSVFVASARADMMVIESNDSNHPIGSRVTGDKIKPLEMEKGSYVKTLSLDTGETKVFGKPPANDVEPLRRKKKRIQPRY